jgi:hypothetical protein
MINKLVVTAIVAAAMTVPLAGAAWAAPSTNAGSTGNGIGKGGVPVQENGVPGETFSQYAKQPGSTPDAISDHLIGEFPPGYPVPDKVPPGGLVKGGTPGANNGNGPAGPGNVKP